ncbi:MAG: NAD(P)/FAD-dependent oxidoreductase [Candidatus Pacebacteria bacterium]|nr:NAD(P)/FAD-dependent oxidoreductase [Candidatus Paceibacterota bacterium]
MDNKKLKVCVIGGGVIGLYLSWKLSELGHEVFVYDRKEEKDLGFKSCSTLVSERIRQFIPRIDDCLENIINSCDINFPKKTIRLNFSPKHLVLDRDKLIKILLDLNKKNNVKLCFGKELKEIPRGFDRVIGCDGAGSFVRKSLGLPNPNMRIGIQVFEEKKDNSCVTKTHLIPSGFTWEIPRGNFVEYGALGEQNEAKQSLDELLDIKDVKKRKYISALVPQGLIIPNNDKITLCGDAMGLTKPWSGGGLIWGLYAADMLIKSFPDFIEYKKQTEKFFNFKIIKGRIANKLVNLFGFYFPYVIPKEMTYDNDFPNFLIAFAGKK